MGMIFHALTISEFFQMFAGFMVRKNYQTLREYAKLNPYVKNCTLKGFSSSLSISDIKSAKVDDNTYQLLCLNELLKRQNCQA